MTEKEFLEKRIPIWLEGEDLHISTPSNMNKNDIAKRIKGFDMSTDTFYYEDEVTLAPKEKKTIASAHIFDIIKFTAWAKNNSFGPWANQ